MQHLIPYIILAIGWVTYLFLHSFLASEGVKMLFQSKFNAPQNYYRLGYNIIGLIGLLVLLFYNGTIQSERLIPLKDAIKYISLFLAGMGVIILNASFKKYNLKNFIGLNKDDETKLYTNGILAYVRHPVYSATILIVIGFFLYDSRISTLVSVICILLYLPIGIHLEEKKLIREYGDQYKAYSKKVPAVLPSFKSLKSLF